MNELTHLDERGRARMVDVGDKSATDRQARAEAILTLAPDTLAAILSQKVPKGDVLAVARLAGILAAKETARLIPLCHSLPLSLVEVEIEAPEPPPEGCRLRILTRARARATTGVEMEALVAASAAALTVYDMCKAIDRGIVIGPLRLLEKTGGKSDFRAE
ncbi:cyclic pyranopterin monophosphate synthase MoaC [bacterium]|nr:cyclic pyranopterin monophosphate synthase MoaC [bacterium]